MRPAGTEKEVGGAVKREKEEEGEGKEEEEEESLLMAALERMDLECLVGLLCEEGGPGLRKDTTDAPDKEQEEKRSGSLEGAGGMEGGTLSGGTYSQEVRGTEREREREGGKEGGERGGGRGEGGGGRRMKGWWCCIELQSYLKWKEPITTSCEKIETSYIHVYRTQPFISEPTGLSGPGTVQVLLHSPRDNDFREDVSISLCGL